MYVAKKPCRFAGIDYRIGTKIPDRVVESGRAGKLVSLGIIAAVQNMQGEEAVEKPVEKLAEPQETKPAAKRTVQKKGEK